MNKSSNCVTMTLKMKEMTIKFRTSNNIINNNQTVTKRTRSNMAATITTTNSTTSDKSLEEAHKKVLARRLSQRHTLTDGYTNNLDIQSTEDVAKASALKDEGSTRTATAIGSKSQEKKKEAKLAGWKHFLAGGIAGACEVITTMPLDVAKTQMQINPGKYKGPIDALRRIALEGGPKALYYGMPSFLTQTSGKAAIRFTGFAQCKELINFALGEKQAAQNQSTVNLFAGIGAGFYEAALWTTPTERLKVLRQSEVGGGEQYKTMIGATRYIIKTQGIRGMFVGVVPTAIRQSSSVGVRFWLYPSVKKLVPGDEDTLIVHMLAGGTVGGLSVALNNPVDVIKNLMQANAKNAKGETMGTFECAGYIYRQSGIIGFYRGLSARVPRVFCGQAVTFAVYEQVTLLLA